MMVPTGMAHRHGRGTKYTNHLCYYCSLSFVGNPHRVPPQDQQLPTTSRVSEGAPSTLPTPLSPLAQIQITKQKETQIQMAFHQGVLSREGLCLLLLQTNASTIILQHSSILYLSYSSSRHATTASKPYIQ